MAESEFNEHFFSQFLDDYFAEADEHLRSVRRHLLEFEDSLNAGHRIQDRTLNELFRSFHTLKGISAMANVSAAETLAHFGWIGGFFGLDAPASSQRTREQLGWTPEHPSLLADLDGDYYFSPRATTKLA